MRSFPKTRFALMGGLDAVAGLFAIVGGALTAGQVQIVVQQANIPITMALSRMYLKISSYAWSQYIGASIIVLGGMVSAFGSGGEGVSAHVVWFGPVLILIGIIPGSMSNVYKESQFKSENIDIYFLTTYVAVWQTILSFVCVPLFTLSYFGGIPSVRHARAREHLRCEGVVAAVVLLLRCFRLLMACCCCSCSLLPSPVWLICPLICVTVGIASWVDT